MAKPSPVRTQQWLLLTVLLLVHLGTCIASVPCSLSKPPCSSAGRVAQHVGDVTGAAELRAALRACSYDNELIVLGATASHLNDLLQMTDALLSAHGFAHVLVVMQGARDCAQLAAAQPGLCCVWTSEPLPEPDRYFGSHRALMHRRLRLAARAVRMRYNLLYLDNDVAVLDNPYPTFAALPLNDKHLVLQGGYPSRLNCGVVRVQNAAPSGVIAWLFADAADRQLRFAESMDFVRDSSRRPTPRVADDVGNLMWDQQSLGDALMSAAHGAPVFHNAWAVQGDTKPAAVNKTWQAQHGRVLGAPRPLRVFRGPAPPHLARLGAVAGVAVGGGGERAGGAGLGGDITLPWAALRVPEFGNGSWQALTGGPPLPPCRGPAAALLRRQLRDAAPDAPLWRDPYVAPGSAPCSGEAAAAAAAARGQDAEERVAYAPPWLIRWHSSGGAAVQAAWDRSVAPPLSAFGHFLWYPLSKATYKPTLRQLTGWHNWSRSEQLRAPLLCNRYLAQEAAAAAVAAAEQNQSELPPPMPPPPRVLALSGAALLHLPPATAPRGALRARLAALAMMGAALGRAVAWPAVPCGDALLGNATGRPEFLGFLAATASARNYTLTQHQQQRHRGGGDGDDGLLCLPTATLDERCLVMPPHGVTEPELARMLSQLPREQAVPARHNTLRASDLWRAQRGHEGGIKRRTRRRKRGRRSLAGAHEQPQQHRAWRPPEATLAQLRQLAAELEGGASAPVLFADALVTVLELREGYGRAGGARRQLQQDGGGADYDPVIAFAAFQNGCAALRPA